MVRFRRSIAWLKVGGAAASLAAASVAHAEYRLQPGDVVEISVAGIPELRQRVPVQLDGSITYPFAGSVAAEGSSLTEVRSRIQSAVASKMFRLRTPDGRELPRIFDREEVSATIVEYRPVFVGGEVMRPGEQVFRPRMTVRQALAAAGGLPTPPRTAALDVAGLQGEYVNLGLSLAREEVRRWGIRTELGEQLAFDRGSVAQAPVADARISEMLDLEREYREARSSDHEKSRGFLKNAIRLADEQIKLLSEQQESEDAGVREDVQEQRRVLELYSRGAVTMLRVNEARRAVLLSSTRQLQTAAQLMNVKRLRVEFARDLERMDDQRRMRLLAEMQETTVKLSGERARLRSAEEKLQLVGIAPLRTAEGSGKPVFTVFRRTASGTERLALDADAELQPGDVVEVALRAEHLDMAAQ